MVIADQLVSTEQESFVIEITEDFEKDLKCLDSLAQKKVNSKLEKITMAIEEGNLDYLIKDLDKINPSLNQYTSSLYKLKIGRDIRIFLFYENDPIFNRKIMTLLRACYQKDMEKLLNNLSQSFYQKQLSEIGD
jgi:mRNA-degrading endonuclease RelE of RelBE toxin-antitoxin system